MAATTSTDRSRGACARHRAGTAAVLAVLAAATVAGCGGPDRQSGASRGGDGQASEPRSAQPPVPAADGHDVGACADGDCEIAVSRPVTVRFEGPSGSATLSVTEVGPNRIEYTVRSGNGRSRAGAEGPGQGCVTVLRGNGSGNSCGPADARPPRAPTGAVVVQAATGKDGTALLRIVSD